MFGRKKNNIGEKKDRRTKISKEQKWLTFQDRLKDALISNVHENQIEKLKHNITLLKENLYDSKLKNRLLMLSIINGSKECAEFLIEEGAISHPNFLCLECKYNKIHIVYELVHELIKKYPESFTEKEFKISKKTLVKRILDPSKIKENKKRIDYLFDNMVFYGQKNIKDVIDEDYKDSPKRSELISIMREIKFRELGI